MGGLIIGVIVFVIILVFVIKIKESIDEDTNKLANFKNATGFQFIPTKRIVSNLGSPIAEFDENSKHCRFYDARGKSDFHAYSSIVAFELLEDGESQISGGLGSALVGGILFGGVGAIVGGVTGIKTSSKLCKSLMLKVTVNNMNNPVVMLTFLEDAYGVETSSSNFKKSFASAHECLSILQLICDIHNQTSESPTLESTSQPQSAQTIPSEDLSSMPVSEYTEAQLSTVFDADETEKLENLFNSGVINEDEYYAAKKDHSTYKNIITGKPVIL